MVTRTVKKSTYLNKTEEGKSKKLDLACVIDPCKQLISGTSRLKAYHKGEKRDVSTTKLRKLELELP